MSNKVKIEKPIIFFDGVCGMCNTFVTLILRADKSGKFLFAPLQGTTAKEMLPPQGDDPREWSMLYLDEAGLHDQSDASLEVYRRLGGLWSVLSLARFVPRLAHAGLSNDRPQPLPMVWQTETCRIPTEEERSRFLP